MSILKKSRKYEVEGANYAFDFVGDKLAGIKKVVNGVLNPIPPKGNEFATVSSSDESLNAFNIAKYGSNKEAYVDATEKLSDEELQSYYAATKSAIDNQQFVDNVSEQPIAFTPNQGYDRYNAYGGGSSNRRRGSDIMAYPLDIDLMQDHMKITRYKYLRADINQSKSARVRADGSNIAGDSVIGKPIEGTIILPMPKPTDVNGVEWGGSDLTSTGIAALGAARGLSNLGILGAPGALLQNDLRNAGVTAGQGNIVGLTGEQIVEQRDAARALKRGNEGNIQALGQSISADALSKLTGVLGADIDVDTFLARTGGRVLNPNAEMLFQGPVIRDFSFEYTMIARSEKEGREIRKIIRFLKLGMAPKFQNTSFLANPDIFTLEYKNGPDKRDVLKTVNLFNPGGLALTTLQTDYAPSGYWSAYRDSQPVAVKLSLAFTELRPIYHGDQDKTPTDSVGY
tara:strand:- start:681 stop:2048 length:1368 start_codon:yes stop_codon:yes gene_type:complete